MLNTLQGMVNQQAANSIQGQMGNLGQIKSMLNAVMNSSNPTGMLAAMAKTNPSIQKAQETIAQYGGDGKAAFYALAKERGMTDQQIEQFLSTLRQ